MTTTRYINLPKGTKIVLSTEVSITGHRIAVEPPITMIVKKVEIQDSHNDGYGEYWPSAVKIYGKTDSEKRVEAYEDGSHRTGYALDLTPFII